VIDTIILAIATALAGLGIGGLMIDEVRAAPAAEGRFSGDLGWMLLWTVGLCVLFVVAWASRRP
jgi:hypothetical protein